jgi:bacteriorhodopsin
MAQPIKTTAPKSPIKTADKPTVKLIFDKSNYKWFIIAIAVVAFGFILMAGTTDIYSNTKIVLAPIVVLTGFAIGFFAILKKPEAK